MLNNSRSSPQNINIFIKKKCISLEKDAYAHQLLLQATYSLFANT